MSNSRKKKLVKIMVFGTFDGLHPGHLNFFQQAKKLVPPKDGQSKKSLKSFLIVSIARDRNVFKIKKRFPVLNEQKRKNLVKKCKLVDKVVLAGVKNHLPHIIKERPEIIALGYDQRAYVKNLKKDLRGRGLSVKIVRLQPYKEGIYKNSLLGN